MCPSAHCLDLARRGVGEVKPELRVARFQGADRVGLQIGERHVDEAVVTEPLPEVHRAPDTLGPAFQLLGAEFLRIVAIAAPAADVGDQTADRCQHLRRITMAPQEFGIRIRLDEGVESEHVHRRLQMPQASAGNATEGA